MKIFKKIIIAIAILIAIPLVVALFIKKDYNVEREIIINKPKQEVFDYIKFLKNQDNYSKWATIDPAMKKEYKGIDGTVGFISAWDSKIDDVGKGEQEIMKIIDGERLDFQLRFKMPFESNDDAYMTTETITEYQTKVKWGFKGRMNYPMNFMLLFMNMEKMLGNDLATGLSNLKKVLENS